MRWHYQGLMFLLLTTSMWAQDPIHLMIITGGHGFERPSFFSMFDRLEGVTYAEVEQPLANQQIAKGAIDQYDLLVFYDMYDSITQEERAAYLKMIQEKKPLLFLHHALVSYQDWPEFAQIVGGKYHTQDSARLSYYQHDDTIPVTIAAEHPVTQGLSDFVLIDETYGNCEILPGVLPLLQTNHQRSMPLLGWVNRYQEHDIVYLQGGHGPSAYEDANFNQLLDNVIRWLVRDKSGDKSVKN